MATSQRTPIHLTEDDRRCLDAVCADPQSRQKHVRRARIILELGSGCGLAETMRRTRSTMSTVCRWWERFLALGVEGLWRDATRPPGRAPIAADREAELLRLAQSPPPEHVRPAGKSHLFS